jgi:NADPH:quinone reductase-like Zn-dependent oxidoreductase
MSLGLLRLTNYGKVQLQQMTTYNRIVVTGHGDTSVLKTVNAPLPEPRQGEVRVRVLAAGVGYADVMAQHGGYPFAPKIPFTPGYDFAGVVDKLGEGAVGVIQGQYVAALNPLFGCYAEYVCVNPKILVPVPDGLDPAAVVSLVLNYLTAHCLLNAKAHIREGNTVLIHAAAGGVGTALLQLGRLKHLTMYGTASAVKHQTVQEFGGIPIDYRTEDFLKVLRTAQPGGVDAAFDPIGGTNLYRSYQAVKKGGVVVSYGFAGDNFGGLGQMIGGVLQIALLNLLPDGKRVRLCATPQETKNNNTWYRNTLHELLTLLSTGAICPVVGARVPLLEARRAHELVEKGSVSGKVVLTCE